MQLPDVLFAIISKTIYTTYIDRIDDKVSLAYQEGPKVNRACSNTESEPRNCNMANDEVGGRLFHGTRD